MTARRGLAALRGAANLDASDLAGKPLEVVLLHGLAASSDDVLEGVLVALRADVRALARASEDVTLTGTLGGWERRLDAAIELRRREGRR